MKNAVILFLIVFVIFCGFLVTESGLFEHSGWCPAKGCIRLASEVPGENLLQGLLRAAGDKQQGYDFSRLTAKSAGTESKILGSVFKDTGYKFEVELTNKGAGISRVVLGEYDNRDHKDPQPLVLLSEVETGADRTVFSLANGNFELVEKKQRFPLDKLNWRLIEELDSEKAVFEAVLKDAEGTDAVRLTKTYSIMRDSYDLDCEITVENLSDETLKIRFNLQGPAGIGREGSRGDMRNIIAAFVMPEGTIESIKLDNNKLRKLKKSYIKQDMMYRAATTEQARTEASKRKAGIKNDMLLRHKDANTHFLWASVTNKYFAAILRAVPDTGQNIQRSVQPGLMQYYDPGIEIDPSKKPDGDENSSFSLQVSQFELPASGQDNSSKRFRFQLYIGPKDKEMFEKNELYRKLAYFHTIKFLGCCCPQAIINPLAFTIMAVMQWMYGFVPNYGVVIIFFVVMVRILLHPVTKKSQISMMKMQKLGPKMEEIKKRYANNKAEMNKKVMELYKTEGVSPVSSMLPMMIQMPIWIALYSAIYANIALRGAGFLPFWITDLSAPDALIRFKEITIPFLNISLNSFNLLPILLGTAMFLQQKLMPHSPAQTNPQAAQQQKMMMIMMPFMMLIFLYKAPSALNLYIMASTFAGVAEQVVIRKHIREREAQESTGLVSVTSKTGGKVKKKKPKPFFKNTM